MATTVRVPAVPQAAPTLGWEDLNESDRAFLGKVAKSLPLLADLSRCDILLYRAVSPEVALVIAEARPNTVPPIFQEPQIGGRINRSAEPTIFETLLRGKVARRANSVMVRGVPTVQAVYPVEHQGRTIAALSLNTALLEAERMKRRDLIFRRAVAQLGQMVLHGLVEGAENIGRLGEHDGSLVVDRQGWILYISAIAENFYRKQGYASSLVGVRASELRTNEAHCFEALETGRCVEQVAYEGSRTWLRKAIPLVPVGGVRWLFQWPWQASLDGAILIIQDITEEWRREQELRIKSAMIREIHHRVKNNLQTIAALLRLQARRTSQEAAVILRESIHRIISIAVVHEYLSHEESTTIDLKEVSQQLLSEVGQGMLAPDQHIQFRLEGPNLLLPAQQATSCALIINELLQNAVMHGYRGLTEGVVSINFQQRNGEYRIEICDGGRGLEPSFELERHANLGLRIVTTLVRDDLQGTFEIGPKDGQGTRALVSFPVGHLGVPNPEETLSAGRSYHLDVLR
ncbi:MAG: PAS domain-containing sensor histidine kinase [Chloroflexi bacterium]|nr:PAS domain-containing sensor histidine kinase [Chloroflexota bacterium]